MKKFWKAILIIFVIGIVLVVIGAIVVATNKEKFGNYFSEEYEEKQYTDERDITSLRLEIGADAVEILPSTDGKLTVIYYESETNKYEFLYDEGKILIKNNCDFKIKSIFSWRIQIGRNRPAAKIYLPNTVTDKLDIELSSGALNSEKMFFNVRDFNLEVASGAVRLKNVTAPTANIRVNSGAVNLENLNFDELTAILDSGALNFDGASVVNASVRVSSGTFKAENIKTDDFTANVSSGTFKLEINEDIENYTIRGTASSGSFKLKKEGEKIYGGQNIHYGNGDKKITVDISSGNAIVDFDDD